MKNKELDRIVPQSDTAVLFIHGIIGTPNYFNRFIPLIPEDWTVCNLLLDGHGKGIDDFAKTSMDKWKAQVEEKVNQLCDMHENIILVGHSMGTLFAIQQGIKNPDKIKALMLLAAPLRVGVKPLMFSNFAKVVFNHFEDDDHMALATVNTFGIDMDKRLWKYLGWIPRYLELFSEIRKTREILSELSVPCYAFQSKNDEAVSMTSCNDLNINENIHTTVLNDSTHYYYNNDDYNLIVNQLTSLVACYS
ncbi:MAG: alpha/beta fold hydrolase [Acutalibacteraceae bacterium]|nr:alpha/beta fold hydrolase [Acutalibacteraceae bacterium]